MARTTKQLSGTGKDKFLRSLIAQEPSIPADVGRRLGDCFCDSIADVRVRREVWQTTLSQTVQPRADDHLQPKDTVPVSGPAVVENATASIVSPASLFDPFAFSALAVLTKLGPQALSDKLASIADPDHLRTLARSQHLSIDPSLTEPDALRAAIEAAAIQRLAERRAAAS